LEGPYFNPAQAGAQPPDKLAKPCDREYEKLVAEYPFIARIDAAPELPGGLDMPGFLKPHGIVAGMAHTDASAAEVKAAAEAGYTIATHLYSGMSVVHRINGYRHAGTVEGCFLQDDVYTEAICDSIHLPAELLQLIYKVKGPDRMILVSDSMRGAGLPEGTECMLGAKDTGTLVVVEKGVAWMPDRQAFAGSVATYDRLIRTAVNYAGLPLTDVIKMATKTPAAVMKLQDKGELKPGFDADVTLFDGDVQVQLTMVEGKVVYQRD
jgi:N-acetylglucosamine-6-phosphate deacetylase